MLAVILGAGEGTRMRPLTYTRPKVMLPVLGMPLIEHIVNACVEARIKRVIIVTGYLQKVIHSYFEEMHHEAEIEFVTQEKQRGTADAIGQVKDFVDDRFLALNGDSLISPITLKSLIEASPDSAAIVAAKRVDDPTSYGIIETNGSAVFKIAEKPIDPRSDLANLGVYSFNPIIFEAISQTPKSARGEYEITDAIQLLIDQGNEVLFLDVKEQWIDIGRPWDLLHANELLSQSLEPESEGIVEPFSTVQGAVKIGRGSIVRNGAYIMGPAIIGERCEIGPNCWIRPFTCIGNGVKIGNAVEIKNSLIMDESRIGHLSYVGDSIIGQRCNFGAGSLVANLRFDGRPVTVDGVHTGRRKLGVIMGDDVQTGINSMINVGTSIGPGSVINMGALASGVYPPGSRIEGMRSR